MALNSTIYKFTVDLSDMDRHLYLRETVQLALHPSETLERMATRFLAYCLHYSERLEFTKGLSTDSEPDVWLKTLTDDIELWLEVGLPDDKRLRKACHQSDQVQLYAYGGQGLDNWLQGVKKEAKRHSNLKVSNLDEEAVATFAEAIERTMSLSCVIQDGQINLSWDGHMLDVAVTELTFD